ncbi:MAG: thiol-disulfide oxidoreductase DCC family protein [Desulfobacterales bacterium]
MSHDKDTVTVYYDGGCPKCVKDRLRFEKLRGRRRDRIDWVDIMENEEELRRSGIDPRKALLELHVRNEHGEILSEIDAYRLLLGKIPILRPLGWVIGLPFIRPVISGWYRRNVDRRLKQSGRL